VGLHRGIDGSDPVGAYPVAPAAGAHHEHRPARSTRVATGTLACPRCDAPVALAAPVSPADALFCPFCRHAGVSRDFLSLAAPARPTRVAVRVVQGARRAVR
jgi:hypothetical protein